MSPRRSRKSLYYLFETLVLAPGILSHEAGHVLACRLFGVRVTHGPVLNPLAEDAYVDHERVERFPADFAIAIAPLVVNTLLGIAAFVVAVLVTATVPSLPAYWLGSCFALTAFPSVGDTETLRRTARQLPRWVRPVGYTLAVLLRGFTRIPGVNGVAGFLWIFVLFGTSRSLLVAAGVPA